MVYFICFFAAVFWIVTAHAGQGFNQTRELSEIKNNISSHTVVESATATPSLLRILPLGASITWGYLSSDNNGYVLLIFLNCSSFYCSTESKTDLRVDLQATEKRYEIGLLRVTMLTWLAPSTTGTW
jgi:hypothetical protein